MALQVVHRGFGRFFVVDGDKVVAGPLSKSDANARAQQVEDAGVKAPALLSHREEELRRKAQADKSDADIRAHVNLKAERIRAVLVELDGVDFANRQMIDIMPILSDPSRQSKRRERQVVKFREAQIKAQSAVKKTEPA